MGVDIAGGVGAHVGADVAIVDLNKTFALGGRPDAGLGVAKSGERRLK